MQGRCDKDAVVKVSIIARGFPVLSQTFVSLQIAGLIDAGVEVCVHNFGVQGDSKFLPGSIRGLLGKVKVFHTRTRAGKRTEKRSLRVFLKLLYFLYDDPGFASTVLRNWLNGMSTYKGFAKLVTNGYCLREARYSDVIHSQFITYLDPLLELKKIGFFPKNPKIVCSVRGYDIGSEKYAQVIDWQRLKEHVDLLLPVSRSLAQKVSERGLEIDTAVVASPIDLVSIHSIRKERRQIRAGEILQILSIGRVVEKKGFDDALFAVKELLNRGVKLNYTIVGDGECLDDLKNFAINEGIIDHVSFLGKLPPEKVLQLLNEADMFLAPCKTAKNGDVEGIPNVVKEAMGLGLQTLSTYHSGIPELIKDGENGYLVEPADPNALAIKLFEVVENKGVWPNVAKDAMAVIDQKYSVRVTTGVLLSAYKRAAGLK